MAIDYKEVLLKIGFSTGRATGMASSLKEAMEEALKKEEEKKKQKIILESKDVTEPLNTFKDKKDKK